MNIFSQAPKAINNMTLNWGFSTIYDIGFKNERQEFYIRYGDDDKNAFWFSHQDPVIAINNFIKRVEGETE